MSFFKSYDKARFYYSEAKHDKEILRSAKLIPCFSNKIFKTKKFYFGGIFSAPALDVCEKKTVFSNSVSFFSLGGSEGAATLTNGFAPFNVKKSYKKSRKLFYSRGLKRSSVWSAVRSNFFICGDYGSTEQLKNLAIKSYRRSLIGQLGSPQTRQDKVLSSRLTESFLNYSLQAPASYFCKQNENRYKNNVVSFVPSTSFFKIQSLFYALGNNKMYNFLPGNKSVFESLFLNCKFQNLSLRESSTCASIVAEKEFGLSFQRNILLFSKNYLFKHDFLNSTSYKSFLLSLNKSLPVAKPKFYIRYLLSRFAYNNYLFGLKDQKKPVNLKFIKSYYTALYQKYFDASPQTFRLIFSSQKATSSSKTFLKKNNSNLDVLNKQLKFQTMQPSGFDSYFSSASEIFDSSALNNFFMKTLFYKRHRTVSYRRSRLPKYYKGLWQLPDSKSMKTRRRR